MVLISINASLFNCNYYRKKNRHKRAFEAILRFIATSNLPFRSADNTFLNSALSILDPTFQLPSKDKMRCEMIDLSQRILNEMFLSIRKQKVSLLLDTCKHWGNTYQGIIIYTYSRLYMWSIVQKNGKKPELITIRWESLLKCVKYINKNYNLYLEKCSEDVLENLEVIEKIIGWMNFSN